ncbi:hypothetical protein ACRJ4W_12175 [Streptomyces sp. GLT-R25]
MTWPAVAKRVGGRPYRLMALLIVATAFRYVWPRDFALARPNCCGRSGT